MGHPLLHVIIYIVYLEETSILISTTNRTHYEWRVGVEGGWRTDVFLLHQLGKKREASLKVKPYVHTQIRPQYQTPREDYLTEVHTVRVKGHGLLNFVLPPWSPRKQQQTQFINSPKQKQQTNITI